MKKMMSVFTSLVMVISMVTVLPIFTATAETYGDYEYTVLDDGTVEITKYNGDADEVVIPSRINGKNVTSIGGWAFADNDDFTSVTIPDGVKAIGDSAFSACFYLQSVTIPGSVTAIGESAFSYSRNLTSVIISDSVTSIGDWVFNYCTGLTNVTIGNSVTSIGYRAFYNCDNLNDVYFDGTKNEWESMSIGEDNEPLISATVHILRSGELKYQLRANDDGSTDVRFILIADEQEVLAADSASVYATIDGTDTDAIIINRAYRSLIAGGKKITADEGKVFLIGKFIGIPDDMVSGMTAHFTLGENTYNRTIAS